MSDEIRPETQVPPKGEALPQGEELTDCYLLDRFTAQGDEAAFTELVRRYGALVLSVCRRVLRHEQDAEDAFQATFLVLVRKAGSIRRRESVGAWLHGVACRIALKVRRAAARRRGRETAMRDAPTATEVPELIWEETRASLDEELDRLPRKYRTAVVLCYLEGKSVEEAALALRCPRGTVLSRLSRARHRLRGRLARCGLALSAAVLFAKLSQLPASAAVPAPEVVAATLQAAREFAVGRRTGDSPARPEALADGCLRDIRRTRLQVAAAGLLSLFLLALAVVLLARTARTKQPEADAIPPRDEAARERGRFTGRWSATEVVFDGRKTPDAFLPQLDMEFEGNLVTMFQTPGTYQLDPSKNPKEITFSLRREKCLFLGIYEFRGEDLIVCHRAPSLGERPTTFQSVPNGKSTLMTLRRNNRITTKCHDE
jgi:RNA polymerase sigma factor (sigma-70 family)